MKIRLTTTLAIAAFAGSVQGSSLVLDGGFIHLNQASETRTAILHANPGAPARIDFGWGGGGGGNLEAYSSEHGSRPGEFNFVFGGGATMGKVKFQHYVPNVGWPVKMQLDYNGDLYVANTINAAEIVVRAQDSNTWPDYVFNKDYDLMPLSKLEKFIEANGHLPDVPTQRDVNSDGVALGSISSTLLRKVEELTLYVIQLQKQNESLKEEIFRANKP